MFRYSSSMHQKGGRRASVDEGEEAMRVQANELDVTRWREQLCW